jgi:hypothetical protein
MGFETDLLNRAPVQHSDQTTDDAPRVAVRLPAAEDLVVAAAIETDPAHVAGPPRGRWQKWFGFAVSAAMAAFVAAQTARIGWHEVLAVLPTSPIFYLLFVAQYLTLPMSEVLIFRRLWALPLSSIWLFLRKRVLNEAVFGYSGEAYIYLWAKRQAGLAERAMGAVKDVSITSALAANVFTVVIVAVLVGFGDRLVADGLFSPSELKSIIWGAIILCVPAFGVLAFSKRIMTLSRKTNVETFWIHMARLLVSMTLLLCAWHFALPEVPWKVWLVLGSLRLVVTRVPFAPNTDLLFSSIGMGLAGTANVEISALLALTAALVIACHVTVVIADWVVRLSAVRGEKFA